MLKRFIFLKPIIKYIYTNTDNETILNNNIKDYEFDYLKIIRNIFKIFINASITLQREYYITINDSLLYIYKIFNDIKSFEL